MLAWASVADPGGGLCCLHRLSLRMLSWNSIRLTRIMHLAADRNVHWDPSAISNLILIDGLW